MFQPEVPEKPLWSVTSLTRHLKDWIESNTWLADCTVQGEVSNFSRPSSGHLYFTLKDSTAQIRCVMWRTQAVRLRESIRDGDQVQVHGQVTVYEAGGQYQLIADSIQKAGAGYLFQEYLRLKEKLEAEELFDTARKRPLPLFPRRIGIVTSPTGAALQDMLQSIARRFPVAQVWLAPAVVQGNNAARSVMDGLTLLLSQPELPDVILIARGGGSIEDLWCFNDENLVRAIADCPVPVVTGIGHETDFTLADFAADRRAHTPTAAAEMVTPDQVDLRAELAGISAGLSNWMAHQIQSHRSHLLHSVTRLQHFSPQTTIHNGRQICDHHLHRIDQSVSNRLKFQRAGVAAIQARLSAVNPYAVLERGYSIVQNTATNEVISSKQQVQQDLPITIRVMDGTYSARANPD